MTKEFRVEVRVKNNLLYRAIEAAGFDSVAAFSRFSGIQQTTIGEYLNLRQPPIGARGWRQPALKMAFALKCLPEDLFPADYMHKAIEQHKVVREYSADEIAGVMKIAQETPEQLMIQQDAVNTLQSALDTLPPRRREVLVMRYGLDGGKEHTLDELAKHFGVGSERIRQIELSGIRQLKHPSRGLSGAMLNALRGG
jgi:hypothetical protein